MAGKVSIEIRGLPALEANLSKLGSDDGMEAVLEEAAFEVEARWKRAAAVDTGRYRASIGTQRVGRLSYLVSAEVSYGPFVEFGTGQRGRASQQPGGVPSEYQFGKKSGMAAQPALRPALIEVNELLKSPDKWKRIA